MHSFNFMMMKFTKLIKISVKCWVLDHSLDTIFYVADIAVLYILIPYTNVAKIKVIQINTVRKNKKNYKNFGLLFTLLLYIYY